MRPGHDPSHKPLVDRQAYAEQEGEGDEGSCEVGQARVDDEDVDGEGAAHDQVSVGGPAHHELRQHGAAGSAHSVSDHWSGFPHPVNTVCLPWSFSPTAYMAC